MKDMNFFNEFLQAKAKARSNRMKGMIGAAIYLAVIIVIYFIFSVQENDVADQLADIEQQLLNPAFQEADREIARLESRINALNNYKSALTELDSRISNFYDFTAEENYKIINAFPPGVMLDKYTINGTAFEAAGFALSIDAIPALTENLKNTGIFSEIHPPGTVWRGIKEEIEGDRDIDEHLEIVRLLSRQLGYQDYTVRGIQGIYEFQLQGTISSQGGE